MVLIILLSTTGLKAAVHKCVHLLSDNNSSISLPFSSVEDLCSHHEDDHLCTSHSHEEHKSDGACEIHTDCCSTSVSIAQLEIDALQSNQNSLEDEIIPLIIPIILPMELGVNLYTTQLQGEKWEHLIPFLQKNQLSFFSQYRI